MKSKSLVSKFLALSLSVATVSPAAFASTWSGGAGTWSSDANPGWNGTGVPNAIGASALFTNTQTGPATTTQDVTAGVTIGTLQYSAADTNFTRTIATTNSITFNQDGAGAGSATISNTNANAGTNNRLSFTATGGSIVLADDLLISNTGGSTSTTASIQIAPVISGTGNITISNVSNTFSGGFVGQIVLSGANTFTGNVLVEKGVVATSGGLGVAGNAVTLGSASNSATLLSTTTTTIANNITVTATSGTNVLGSTSSSASNTIFSGNVSLNGDVSLFSAKPSGGTDVRYTGVLSGSGSVTTIGTGETQFGSGSSLTNTYTGNTTLSEASSLVLSDNAKLTFVIGANGVNNQISGTAAQLVTLDGDFIFDLTGAAGVGTWTIVDRETVIDSDSVTATFGGSFTVVGFTDNGTTWSSGNYTFNEATGILTAVPEPSTFAMLLGGVGMLVLRRARRAKTLPRL